MMSHNHNEAGCPHGSLRQCLIGFILSVVLTAIPFLLVMQSYLLDRQIMFIGIVLCAIAQILVHLVCFLHMNLKVDNGWSFMAMIFTIIIIAICFIGSIWVMYHLNNNMMPMDPSMSSIHK